MIEFKPQVKYAYSTGRVRVLETKLLSNAKVDRMIESPTISDALVYLEDTAYDDTLGEIRDPSRYEEMVKEEKKLLARLMGKLIFDSEIIDLLKVTYDFVNLKMLIKGRLTGMDTSSMLSVFGTTPLSIMKQAFETENFNFLPAFAGEVTGEAIAHHYINKDLKTTEFLIDGYEYNYKLSLAGKSKIPFLSYYVRTKIDLVNISTFLRIKYFHTSEDYDDVLIGGGELPKGFFLKMVGEPIETVSSFFSNTPYAKVVLDSVRDIVEKGSFSTLDREADNLIMRIMQLTRYVTFGIEPVVAYFIARQQDLNIVKMILVGKLNEIPAERMRERIPVTFN